MSISGFCSLPCFNGKSRLGFCTSRLRSKTFYSPSPLQELGNNMFQMQDMEASADRQIRNMEENINPQNSMTGFSPRAVAQRAQMFNDLENRGVDRDMYSGVAPYLTNADILKKYWTLGPSAALKQNLFQNLMRIPCWSKRGERSPKIDLPPW